jgi:uncharacterized protein YjbI with pentapeptide repeats
MADSEQLKILAQDVEYWNKWRQDTFSSGIPDLNLAYLRKAYLKGADLSRANFSGADLSGADLSGAKLREATLIDAKLSGADLRGKDLGGTHLSGADLSEAKLSKAILSQADLSKAKLIDAKLNLASLWGADLSEAKLSRANLRETNLRMANLSEADFSYANLNNVNLSRTKLYKTNFRLAAILHTIFVDIDLSNVSNLESIRQFGPSFIGIDTIFRSGGKIPSKFLEDAGVPDIFIEYMGSLTGQAFQFYSCFISHSTNDKEFANRLFADLKKEGVRCWFAPEDMKGGKKLHRQLDEAIRIHDKLLLILSEQSISSDWVANEIRWARKREKQEGKQKLFPVSVMSYEKLRDWELFDADTATDLSAEVRSYYIPDFTNWKDHDSYQPAFKRLLRDLQATEQ